MRPIKIDFCIRSLGHGGAERQLIILASGLAKRGHQVRILTFYGSGHYEAEALARGIEVLNLNKKGRFDFLPFLIRFARALKAHNPDLIHGYLSGANLVTAILKPFHRRPIVWGIRASNIDLSKYDWMARLDARLEAFCSRFTDLIIANSKAGRRHAISQGFPENRIEVIDNGFECRSSVRIGRLGHEG